MSSVRLNQVLAVLCTVCTIGSWLSQLQVIREYPATTFNTYSTCTISAEQIEEPLENDYLTVYVHVLYKNGFQIRADTPRRNLVIWTSSMAVGASNMIVR